MEGNRSRADVDLINKGTMEPVTEKQNLRTEAVDVDTVRSLDDRHLNQQLGVRRRRKLKKCTQGNGVSRKKFDVARRSEIRRAVLKGNMHKGPGSQSSAKWNSAKKDAPGVQHWNRQPSSKNVATTDEGEGCWQNHHEADRNEGQRCGTLDVLESPSTAQA